MSVCINILAVGVSVRNNLNKEAFLSEFWKNKREYMHRK